MKKYCINFITLLLCFMCLFSLTIHTFAAADDFKTSAKDAINSMNDAEVGDAEDKVGTFTSTIINIVTIAGSVLGVVMIIVFGIRWMIANPAQKSKLKEEAWSYVLGAVFLFGAGPIAQLIYTAVNSVNSGFIITLLK